MARILHAHETCRHCRMVPRAKVLIVEDNSDVRRLYAIGLNQHGFEVKLAANGTEESYRLQTHRPFTVGRDPGNDIILRDPKVSRHHAEIIFERGFFVVHDLTSANGTYINGKRVRVAPLTHSAKVRMGN